MFRAQQCSLALRIAALLLVASTWSLAGEPSAAPAITAESVLSHVRYLASDELGGRDSGEPGLEIAADYIAERLREYGVAPAGDHGSYFQHFTVPRGATFGGEPGATVKLPGGQEASWLPGRDVEAFGHGDAGTVEAPLVFAGYGITTGEREAKRDLRYDDYDGIDVKEKVVILLRFVPRYGRSGGAFGGRRSSHAPFVAKLKNAKDHGAAGVIFVTPPTEPEDDPYGLAHRSSPRQATLPALVARRAAVDRLLWSQGRSLSRLAEAIDRDLKPQSFELKDARIRFATTRRHLRLRNVVGRLEGSDPTLKSETILIGGHYDHIGRFGNQVKRSNLGKVHNGADDNASGVAGVLELARVFAAGERPQRSLVFVAFSAEEIGLLGSRHWVNAPRRLATSGFTRAYSTPERPDPHGGGSPAGGHSGGKASGAMLLEGGTVLTATGKFQNGMVEVKTRTGSSSWIREDRLKPLPGPTPLHQVVTMVNLDMIGRAKADGAVRVLGGNTADAFKPLLEELSKKTGVPVRIAGGGMRFGGSDHMHFLRQNIPVLFFFTGAHSRYNTPEDDTDTINAEGEARILTLVSQTVRRLADAPARPQFKKEASLTRLTGRGRPRLGVQLDPEYRGKGVRIRETVPDTPAGKSELRPGDVVLRFGDKVVNGIPDLLDALDERPQGKVKLLVSRGDKEIELTVEFPSRGGGFGVRFGSVPDYAYADRGVRFDDIYPGSPAAKAGVKSGDVLVRWGDKDVADVESWTRLLRGHKPGDVVQIQVRRGDKLVDLKVRLEAR